MTVNRQDAWSEDDDLLLAEVILRHIRDGSTQLKAFEEVAEKLTRTAAACGFRWNSVVRKRYEAAIDIAKAQRQAMKKNNRAQNQIEKTVVSDHKPKADNDKEGLVKNVQFEEVIKYLRQLKSDCVELRKRNSFLEKQNSEYELENKRLQDECINLRKEKHQYDSVSEDYKALIQIMDRARRLTVLDDSVEEKKTFKMDLNGNLERV